MRACMQHIFVTFIMLVFCIVPAYDNWPWGDWPCFAIHCIVHLYSTVMINLLMIKLRGQQKSCALEKSCNEEIATPPKV